MIEKLKGLVLQLKPTNQIVIACPDGSQIKIRVVGSSAKPRLLFQAPKTYIFKREEI